MSSVQSRASGAATEDSAVSGAERLVAVLEAQGVEVVFGLPGVHNLSIWRALSASRIRLVGVRHEQTAAYAADGYARATGRLGVAVVTTGPGAANTLGAVGEAMASGSPLLVIATDIPAALRRPGVYRGVLHETRDQQAMFAPVVKYAHTVASADAIADDVRAAADIALSASTGPVYVGIPTDLLAQPAAAPAPAPPHVVVPLPGEHELAAAAALIEASERPLIWAGGGALRAGARDAVGALAERLAAPVVTTYMARGLLDPEHPCCVGGPPHMPEVGALWDEADLVIAIGSDFDGMMTQNWSMPAPARLLAINVDAADAAKNYPTELTLVGDARSATAALAQHVPQRPGAEALAERLASIHAAMRASLLVDEPQALRFLDAMHEVLQPDDVVVADMCIPGYWLGGFQRVRSPRGFAYPVGWGTLGFGFPASLGAALSGRGRTVCVCGDGGFLFAAGELATIAQERIPVTVVIVDDGGYGMLRYDQIVAGDETFGVDLATPDFVALARAFGLDAVHVEGFGPEFVDQLFMATRSEGPNVVVVSARLKPPPTTSPRWYRRAQAHGGPSTTQHQETS